MDRETAQYWGCLLQWCNIGSSANGRAEIKVNFAHLRERSTNGGWVDFAVFDADATSHGNEDRSGLLLRLTLAARSNGLKVDKAVLVYRENGRIRTWGAPDIVKYLSSMGVPR